MAKRKSSSAKPAKKKARAKGSTSKIVLGDGIWPLERDVLFRPDRLKYVRKLIKDEGCVFCRAAQAKPAFETLCVRQTEHSMVVLNKFPYNSGHVLILPRRHCGDMLQLSEAEWSDLCDLKRETLAAVQDAYEPGGVNMGLNHGSVAGAGIPDHLHFHLIPRWSGDLNFFPLVAETKVVIEDLESSYKRIHEAFARRSK